MPADLQKARELFLHAVGKLPPEQWDRYVAEACGEDADLQQQVTSLLQVHREAGSFLDAPAPGLGATFNQPLPDKPGVRIGPYKLLQQIGDGGMGVVYMAEQTEPVHRRVALKIIKPGVNTREVVARFEAERQALALMDHPNIAKVLDAGTTETGQPFFVMELVKGQPITRYCDDHRLTPRQRLELFIPVCHAIQHAHQKGLIHRDIKPSNILIAPYDGQPVVKVIDFGIAKATGQRLTDKTLFTQFGALVGTLEYMSPEQAELNNQDVDTRSDIYSLGVLLYKLLTGSTPLDRERLQTVAFDELLRIVREVEPPRPSTRLSESHDTLPAISAQRQTEPANLTRLVRGELDWIVMKALDKNRNRRYETANGLAMDVQRYLDDEPVQACPPSVGYRFRKFARRNRGGVVAAAIVLASLLIAIVGTTWGLVQAEQRRTESEKARMLADERLENEKQARADEVKQRQQASENLQKALEAVDQMLLRVADERLAAIPGAEPVRQELFQDALRFYEEFFRQAPDDPQLRTSIAKAWARVGTLHGFLGNPVQAQAARQEALQRWEALYAESPDDPQFEAALAQVHFEFGFCEHWGLAKFATAGPFLERAISLWQDLQRRFPDNLDYQWEATRAESTLGDNYKGIGKHDLAERALRHAVDVQRELWSKEAVAGKKRWYLCFSLNLLANFLDQIKKRDDEAEPVIVEGLRRGEELIANDPRSITAMGSLIRLMWDMGDLLNRGGRFAEAEKFYRRAIEVAQQIPRVNPHDVDEIWTLPRAQVALADLLAQEGRYIEALKLYRVAGDLLRPGTVVAGRWNWKWICDQADQGLLRTLQLLAHGGRLGEARMFCEELTENGLSGFAALPSQVLAARAWESIGEVDRGRNVRNEFVQRVEQQDGDGNRQPDRAAVARAVFSCADGEFHRMNYEAAFPLLELALKCNPSDSEALDHRGQIFLAQGQADKALADFDESIRHGATYGAGTFRVRALAYFRLAHYSRALVDLAQAVQLSPSDARNLIAIDPAEVVACPDDSFRKSYLAWFQQAVAAANSSTEARVHRSALMAVLGKPDSVPGDLAAVLADGSAAPHVLHLAALVALRSGDPSRYREFCRLLATRAQGAVVANQCHEVVWAAVVAPRALDDYQTVIAAARRGLIQPEDRTALLDLGGILYRAGQLNEALDCLTRAENATPTPRTPSVFAHYFLAMTHQKLGHDAEAREWYGRSIGETERLLAEGKNATGEPLSWKVRLILELLRTETTAVFGEPPVRDDDTPAP